MTILLQTQVFFCFVDIYLSKSVDVKWIQILCAKKRNLSRLYELAIQYKFVEATGRFQYHSSGRLIITRYPVNTFQFSRWVWGTEKESLISKIESLMLSWCWFKVKKNVNTNWIYAGGGRWLVDIGQRSRWEESVHKSTEKDWKAGIGRPYANRTWGLKQRLTPCY